MSDEIRDSVNGIITAIADRERTDVRLPPSMIAIVMLAYILVTFYYIILLAKTYPGTSIPTPQMFTLSALLMIGTGIVIAIFYILMSRNAKHAAREMILRENMIAYAELNNYQCGSDITAGVQKMKEIDGEIRKKEDTTFHKWKLFFILIPTIIGVLLLTFMLTNGTGTRESSLLVIAGSFAASVIIAVVISPTITTFAYKHERRAIPFFAAFNDVSNNLALRTETFERTVGYRSFWLFLILSVITLGLFTVVWVYLVFSDLNHHFDEQWYFEDALFKSVRSAEVSVRDHVTERGKDYKLEDHWT